MRDAGRAGRLAVIEFVLAVGAFAGGDDVLWVVWMLSVVGTTAWCLVLGVVLLRSTSVHRRTGPTRDVSASTR